MPRSHVVWLGWSQLGCWHSQEWTLLRAHHRCPCWNSRLGTGVSSVTRLLSAGTVMEQEPNLDLP